ETRGMSWNPRSIRSSSRSGWTTRPREEAGPGGTVTSPTYPEANAGRSVAWMRFRYLSRPISQQRGLRWSFAGVYARGCADGGTAEAPIGLPYTMARRQHRNSQKGATGRWQRGGAVA